MINNHQLPYPLAPSLLLQNNNRVNWGFSSVNDLREMHANIFNIRIKYFKLSYMEKREEK